MWPFPRKRKEAKVVFNREHIWREPVPISRRALTQEEMEWVRQSLRARKELADFSVPQQAGWKQEKGRWVKTVTEEELPYDAGQGIDLEPEELVVQEA
jgi:hypothetical protein